MLLIGGYSVIGGAAMCPDLNPIEHVQYVLGRSIQLEDQFQRPLKSSIVPWCKSNGTRWFKEFCSDHNFLRDEEPTERPRSTKYRMDQIQQVGRAEDSDSKLVYHLMSSRNSPRT
ncbi:hypothetical protein TNCV_917921 [Trichonephila clavipes]|nr:hypothetical protein TNCV_917921 [Trichonephila clavipes]